MVVNSMGKGKQFSTNKYYNLNVLPDDAEGCFTRFKLRTCHLTENWKITCMLGKVVSLVS